MIVLVALFAFVLAFLSLFCLIPFFQSFLPDLPNARSSHIHPTPRGGGIVFVVVSSVFSGFLLFTGPFVPVASLPLLAAPLAVVGLLDDLYNLSASLRFGFQLLTASLMVGVSPLVQQFALHFSSSTCFLLSAVVLLMITITAVINFTNFMDGLDGLVAGCMSVTIAAISISLAAPWSLWTLVGSLLAFLCWNWSPAKVFMGDVGSTFLGAVLAGLILQASSWLDAFVYLLLATPLLSDSCCCVFRRLMSGQRVFQAHRLHLFQRLQQAGWPHYRVSLVYILATGLLAFGMLAGGGSCVFPLAFAELLVGVWLDKRVAVPFAVASQS